MDFRDKWDSNESLRKQYDGLVREMVVTSKVEDGGVEDVLSLIKGFIACTRENLEY